MSALSYLCGYGSNSEESDSELEKIACKRPRLPLPNLSKVTVVPTEVYEDNPELHNGRARSFPHVRGNWATFVYVKYCAVDAVNTLIDRFQPIVLTKVESVQRCDDFHISLSRTVVLKYHLISAFRTSLQETLKNCEGFDLQFSALKIFCNEENSRTFIALEVDPLSHKHLLAITNKVDDVLTDFQLPTFYETPSFHMSILSVNGNKYTELTTILEELYEILVQDIENLFEPVLVDTISCKSGNKYFQYLLK